MADDATKPPLPQPMQDEFVEYMKKLDEANIKLQTKMREDTDKYQAKVEALAGTTLASYPTFQPFLGIGKIIAAVKQSDIDRTIILQYLDSIVAAGTTAKADGIRAAVRAIFTPTVGG